MEITLPTQYDGGTAALVVAHPGHELRVHAWVELVRPRVFVLTDGSGHGGEGRIASTAAVLTRAGASAGTVFAPWSDAEAYRLILEGDEAAARALVEELAAELVREAVEIVVSDAIEGFNPVHDLCRVLADAAAAITSRRLGRDVLRYDFLLDGPPGSAGGIGAGDAILLELDEDALRRKLGEARAYPKLREEVDRALARYGAAAFSSERLRPTDRVTPLAELVGESPFYEQHGERRVAEGTYTRVLRARTHFFPLATAIVEWARSA